MSGAPSREVARRAFAREFNDGSYTFTESEDERAPVYLLLPTGEKANRVFVVGTLTETEDVGEDSEYWRGRVVDPNGDPFFVYAGQYQPEAANVLRKTDPPEYVAVAGKPRTYETDDGTVNVSLRPESITPVDAGTRDRWVVETARRTIERVRAFGDRLAADDAATGDDAETADAGGSGDVDSSGDADADGSSDGAGGDADGSGESAEADTVTGIDNYARMAREQYGSDVGRYLQAAIQALESLEDDERVDGGDGDEDSTDDAEQADDGDEEAVEAEAD